MMLFLEIFIWKDLNLHQKYISVLLLIKLLVAFSFILYECYQVDIHLIYTPHSFKEPKSPKCKCKFGLFGIYLNTTQFLSTLFWLQFCLCKMTKYFLIGFCSVNIMISFEWLQLQSFVGSNNEDWWICMHWWWMTNKTILWFILL